MILPITPDDMRVAAKKLSGMSETLDKYATSVESEKMERIYYHWVTFRDTTLPELFDFLDELGTAVSVQIRAAQDGRKNPYVFQMEKAAKYPRKKKGSLEQQVAAAERAEDKATRKVAKKAVKKKGA